MKSIWLFSFLEIIFLTSSAVFGQVDLWEDYKPEPLLISRGKHVTQSSTASNGPAQYANDEKYDQNYSAGTCTHTQGELNPWWKIDLGSRHYIEKVKIWNRADCCGERLNSLKLQTSDDDKEWTDVAALTERAANGGVFTLNGPAYGRYARLILSKPTLGELTLCEVEVYGNQVKAPLISRGKVVTQSSTAAGGLPIYAIDGRYDQNYFGAQPCTHTESQKNPWWKINLGAKYHIDYIKIWNRADCCGERLNTLKVQTSNKDKHWEDVGTLNEHPVNGGVYTIYVQSQGQYIRLIITKDEPEALTLCEVEIYGTRLKAT